MEERKCPEGYRVDARGRFVPEVTIKQIDRLRDELVNEIVDQGLRASVMLADIKRRAIADIDAFVTLAAEQYKVFIGGGKGNIQLRSFDGAYMIMISIDERIAFNETLVAAQHLIDEYFDEELAGRSAELSEAIKRAFQIDKNGNIATKRILGLRQLNINHPKWLQAMRIISDSVIILDSKRYLRIYKRDNEGKYSLINLDLASV
jgi:hypothetical protein